jgi:hypothetical protein
MAESLRPWLVEYLVGIGERFGGNLTGLPLHEKKKKVQLVEVRRTFVIPYDDNSNPRWKNSSSRMG